jgi:TM2 domain-containing membrane protein YozV
MKKIAVALGFAAASLALYGQGGYRYPWVDGKFPPAKGDFAYQRAYGESANLSEARRAARSDFFAQISSLAGEDLKSDAKSEISSSTSANSASTSYKEKEAFEKVTTLRGKEINVAYVKVGEYYEEANGAYRLWELYEYRINFSAATEASFTPYIPAYSLVSTYSQAAAKALSFVPFGVAQFYKGNGGWGAFFLVSEAAFIAGAGLTWYMSGKYYDDFMRERNAQQRAEYKRLTQGYETLCYISLGVAGGLYVSGLLHGLFADGKRKEYRLTLAPYATPQSNGVALSLKF